jgi:hypothetical protein
MIHRREALLLLVGSGIGSAFGRPSLAGQRVDPRSKTGIIRVTRGPADLVGSAKGRDLRYGLGCPFQVSPRQAGLIANLRTQGFPVGDFEAGIDMLLFDRIDAISAKKARPVTRTSKYADRHTGEWRVAIKYWASGGFVPWGARLPKGAPHPHAGTGFLLCEVTDVAMKGSGYYGYYEKAEKDKIRTTEICQLAYDGREFRVVETEARTAANPLRADGSEWTISAPGLQMAVPDGNDLLYACYSAGANRGASGVSRWRRLDRRWQLISFVPIAFIRMPEEPRMRYGEPIALNAFEPSLIRDTDGSLLFTLRASGSELEDHIIRVWRSTDTHTWELAIEVPQGRGQAPVTLNQAADGTPYLAGNRLGHERDWLVLWPLNRERSGLEEPITVRNALEQFGPPPSGRVWFMDHPMAQTVRLADGGWHNLLLYRIMDRGEHSGLSPAPQSGLYVEEVVSAGPPIPLWNFE